MSLPDQQVRLARTIDTHAQHVLAQARGDEVLLMSLAVHMGTFKHLIDMSSVMLYNGAWPMPSTRTALSLELLGQNLNF